MKNKKLIIVLFHFSFFLPALSFAQENTINRAFLGGYGSYMVPIFGFYRENYKAGPSLSLTYLSRKLPVFKQLPYSLRIGATIEISEQGNRYLKSTAGDSLKITQNFHNNFSHFSLLGRFTFEKNRILKPYLELSFGLGTFSSNERITTNKYTPINIYSSRGNYEESMAVFGISAGYLLKVTEWFMIDAKITYYQGTKKTPFSDLDHFSYTAPFYNHIKRDAVPSLISARLGLLFRLPRVSFYASAPYSNSSTRPSHATPRTKTKTVKENQNGELVPSKESTPQKPKETKTYYGPKKRH